MSENIIAEIKARQILDSRGNPTVEADVYLASGQVGRAAVPSGASTGSAEALELRDGDPERFAGRGVLRAVWNVNSKIRDVLIGNTAEQRVVDQMMIDLDGTENKSNLGANAILAVSLATAKAVAKSKRQFFYQYVAELADNVENVKLPMPMMNVMNGGVHGGWATDWQEYMIVPVGAETMADAVRMGAEVFYALAKILKERGYATTVGDEGGFAPKLRDGNNEPLELMKLAIERAGYEPGREVAMALDVAATEFFVNDHYELRTNGDWKTAENLMDWYQWVIDNYPVVSIEDGLAEQDFAGWKKLTERMGERVQLVGDDLFVTNVGLLERGIAEKMGNAILIKPNQIGTLTETINATMMAQRNGFNTVISHRSGETEDVSIAHLAIGLGAGQIKTGSLSRVDRVAKYNELMRMAEFNKDLMLERVKFVL